MKYLLKRKGTKRKSLKGITLIELLIVVAIITILAAILLPYVSNRSEDAKIAAMEEMINSLRSATALMFNDGSIFPTEWRHFVSPVNPPYTAGVNWRGPYLQRSSTATGGTWTNASPWKTDLVLFFDNNGANTERFASSTNLFPFRYGIALQVVNPYSTTNAIPISSLQKIDQDLDDGLTNSGYIVFTTTATTPIGASPNLNFVTNYNTSVTTNSYFDILINAIP